jgi:GNAT superfamily N-acetyltransferase
VVVDSIGVTARVRGCGVGKRLMQRAEAWACEQGASEFELSVHTFNQNAITFYTLFGMKPYVQRMSKPLHIEDPAHKDA